MKKTCVISANCQGAYFKALLEHHPVFRDEYECHYYVNYERQQVPQDVLARADILIYQPLTEKWGEHSEKVLLESVPVHCARFRINYLTFPVYWPFQVQDARNHPDASFPFGQFPYGDSFVINRLAGGLSPREILHDLSQKDLLLEEAKLDLVIQQYVEKQKEIEQRRDQKLLSYIMENYRTEKLFETFNHPSWVLCLHQVNDFLIQFGYAPISEGAPRLEYLKSNQQPIHPLIAEGLNLEFSAGWEEKYNIWHKPMTVREYYRAYVEWDVDAIGKAVSVEEQADIKLRNRSVMTKMKETEMKQIQREQLLFVHIPKTAGTSLNHMLADAILGSETFRHYNSTSHLLKDKGRRNSPVIMGHVHYDAFKTLNKDCKIFTILRDPIDRTISAFEFMKSHPETWLGELAQGTISEFLENEFVAKSIGDVQTRLLGVEINFQRLYAELKNNRITEEEYVSIINEAGHVTVGEAELERAKEHLANMLFFGFTETFSDDVATLFAKLGYPCPEVRQSNRTPEKFKKRDKYSQTEIELIRSLNRYDVQLYEYAKQLRAARESQQASQPQS